MNASRADQQWIEQTLGRLTLIVEQMNEGVAAVDLQGVLHFINPAMVRMHGYRSSEGLIGQTLECFHSSDQLEACVRPMMQEVLRSGHLQGSVNHTRRDGAIFPTQTKMIRLDNEDGQAAGVILWVTDQSESIRAMNALNPYVLELEAANDRLSRQVSRLQQTVEATTDGLQTLGIKQAETPQSPVSFNRDNLENLAAMAKSLTKRS